MTGRSAVRCGPASDWRFHLMVRTPMVTDDSQRIQKLEPIPDTVMIAAWRQVLAEAGAPIPDRNAERLQNAYPCT